MSIIILHAINICVASTSNIMTENLHVWYKIFELLENARAFGRQAKEMNKGVVFLELAWERLEKKVGRGKVPKYIGTSLFASIAFSVLKNLI